MLQFINYKLNEQYVIIYFNNHSVCFCWNIQGFVFARKYPIFVTFIRDVEN